MYIEVGLRTMVS